MAIFTSTAQFVEGKCYEETTSFEFRNYCKVLHPAQEEVCTKNDQVDGPNLQSRKKDVFTVKSHK